MHGSYPNINDAFFLTIQNMVHHWRTTEESSRHGPVIRVVEPVTITYRLPKQRVLFNLERDANPFFHLFEALWMLAGRNDLETVQRFNSRMVEFSDDGKILRGAYGYRWREAFARDQLGLIAEHLRDCSNSRRAVLEMWSPADLSLVWMDPSCKDVPCNTHAYFEIVNRTTDYQIQKGKEPKKVLTPRLNMTVCNRSNDLLWGMFGANVVHFSILQEYMAAKIGVGVGVYNQFTNNLHVYKDKWKPEKWTKASPPLNYLSSMRHLSLVDDIDVFDRELAQFVNCLRPSFDPLKQTMSEFSEPFIEDVAVPMLHVWVNHRARKYAICRPLLREIKSDDWKIACTNWINKRERLYEADHPVPIGEEL